MRHTRWQRWLLLMILPATLAVSACGSSGDDDATAASAATGTAAAAAKPATDTVKVAFIGATEPYGIEAWGVKQGIFEKALNAAGIGKVQFVAFPNGPDAGAAQASGAIDVALVGDLPGVATKASGIDTSLVSVSGTDLDAWLLTGEDSGLTTVQDLAGKKVAVAQGSYMDKYLTALLKEEGLTDKVKKINLLPPNALTALAGGDIDAYAGPPFYSTDLLAKNKIKIIDHANDHGLGGITTTTVRTKFAADHPGFAQAWNDAVLASRADAVANSEAFYADLAKAQQLDLDQAKEINDIASTLPEDQLDPTNVESVEATAQFLVDNKLQSKLVDIQDWILDPDAHGTAPGA